MSEKESKVNIQQSPEPYKESSKNDIHYGPRPFNQGSKETNNGTNKNTTTNHNTNNNNNSTITTERCLVRQRAWSHGPIRATNNKEVELYCP